MKRPASSALLFLVAACTPVDPPPPSLSPNARPEILEALREDLATERHPSDGGGTVEIIAGPAEVAVAASAGWRFRFQAGPLGIAKDGWLFFQVSPFWNWTTPQVTSPSAPGYTIVTTAAPGVELDPVTLDQQLLGIQVRGRALAEGEAIEIAYGTEGGAARVDQFAEQRSPFWFAVDGDGDGIRKLLAPVSVDVVSPDPHRLALTLPSVVRPGARAMLRLAPVDAIGNRVTRTEMDLEIEWIRLDVLESGSEYSLPTRATIEPGAPAATVEFMAPDGGSWMASATTAGGLSGRSNPLVVDGDLPLLFWGDLHGHSNLSDGTGTPEQYFTYARDIAGLDFVALTDHDHWGLEPLATHPEMWRQIREQVTLFNQPQRFVTLLGYEWTSWTHGHRHVLYFTDDGPVLSSVDPRYDDPAKLWDALRPFNALTFAHHSVGDPVATNWSYRPDPELEPVTEIASIHGSSEAADGPTPARGAIAGNFVRDVLDRGYELGFIGSGDGHDGHPGLSRFANPTGGLAAIASAELTRSALRAGLGARRTYATNGDRIFLDARLDGHPLGARVPPTERPVLTVRVAGTAALERLDIIQAGEPVRSIDLKGRWVAAVEHPAEPLETGDYLYVRVLQEEGGAAWSSPFFVATPIR